MIGFSSEEFEFFGRYAIAVLLLLTDCLSLDVGGACFLGGRFDSMVGAIVSCSLFCSSLFCSTTLGSSPGSSNSIGLGTSLGICRKGD